MRLASRARSLESGRRAEQGEGEVGVFRLMTWGAVWGDHAVCAFWGLAVGARLSRRDNTQGHCEGSWEMLLARCDLRLSAPDAHYSIIGR